MAKPKGHYDKKKYSLTAVRAHISDAFKGQPFKTLTDTLLGLQKSIKNELKTCDEDDAEFWTDILEGVEDLQALDAADDSDGD